MTRVDQRGAAAIDPEVGRHGHQAAETVIRLTGVHKAFGDKRVLRGVDHAP